MQHILYSMLERKLYPMSVRYTLFLVFLILATFFPSEAEAESKIGHINFDELIKLMPGYERAQKSLVEYKNELSKKLKNMQEELDAKVDAYSREKDELADSVKVFRTQELLDLENRIDQYSSIAEQSYRLRENELFQPIIENARKVISDVARGQSFTYIFHRDDSIILYLDESQDILPLAKERLKASQK